MKKLLCLAAVLMLVATPLVAQTKGEWTGYITDSHCGKKGATNDHDADCVEKCMKGGAKARIWNDADGKAYDLDGFDKVKALIGSKVTVKGALDARTKTIKVESATKAAEK